MASNKAVTTGTLRLPTSMSIQARSGTGVSGNGGNLILRPGTAGGVTVGPTLAIDLKILKDVKFGEFELFFSQDLEGNGDYEPSRSFIFGIMRGKEIRKSGSYQTFQPGWNKDAQLKAIFTEVERTVGGGVVSFDMQERLRREVSEAYEEVIRLLVRMHLKAQMKNILSWDLGVERNEVVEIWDKAMVEEIMEK